MARIEFRISEDGSTVALHAFHVAGEVVSDPRPAGSQCRLDPYLYLVTGSSRVEWPDETSEVAREIAVTDLETCCWKIPRTADALETTGLPEAARLAFLRAEPGQVLGSDDAEEES